MIPSINSCFKEFLLESVLAGSGPLVSEIQTLHLHFVPLLLILKSFIMLF